MKSWKEFIEAKNEYSYSSTQINLPKKLAEKIIKWGKKTVPDEDLFIMDGSYGREDEIHATVLYGLYDNDPQKIEELLKNEKSFEIELCKSSIFTSNLKFDVVKLGVESEDLRSLNKKLRSRLEHFDSFHKYQPHVTIAYVKKGKGWQRGNDNTFKGVKVNVDKIVFSSKNGTKTSIELNHS